MDRARMVALVTERLKVRLDEDDPAFVLVELNRLALEETASIVVDRFVDLLDQRQFAQEPKASRLTLRLLRSPATWTGVGLALGLALLTVGAGAGYWSANTVRDAEAARAEKVLQSPEGRAAVHLAELGQARLLTSCSQPGWTLRDGYCYGTAKDGRVTGWRVKSPP